MAWLPGFLTRPGGSTSATGHHLRPIREADVEIDYPAVMGSRERLWRKYGEAWGWPPADMSFEDDRRDLARHEAEIAAPRRSTTPCSTPPRRRFSAASTSIRRTAAPVRRQSSRWWVSTRRSAPSSSGTLDQFVPRWLAEPGASGRWPTSPDRRASAGPKRSSGRETWSAGRRSSRSDTRSGRRAAGDGSRVDLVRVRRPTRRRVTKRPARGRGRSSRRPLARPDIAGDVREAGI